MIWTHSRVARAAFTLIELLVVVAIIAVLISILLPSLNLARKQARGVVCGTNLRSHGQANQLYSQTSNDWAVRGFDDDKASPNPNEYIDYAISLMRGLGYDGKIAGLWEYNGMRQPNYIATLKKMPIFRCPSHPDQKQPLSYVASAFPIPYTTKNEGLDAGGGQFVDGNYRPIMAATVDYVGFYKADSLDKYGPARLVLATEGHVSLPIIDMRFHHMFLADQLPFGAYPRIANDLRHPGGINGLFYDGHVQMIRLQNMDVGWPNKRYVRTRYFTTPAEE